MMGFGIADAVAILWFAVVWLGYSFVLEHTRFGHGSLNARMDRYRYLWMHEMAAREVRIVDTAIMGSLQSGAAFFASTSLIALGGALSLLRAPDELLQALADVPYAMPHTHESWNLKVVGLAVIFAYAFFKFGWCYRLMNYAAILIGATPILVAGAEDKAFAAADRAAAMNLAGAAHFNRGQRSFFFALGYLGWFISPYVFIVSTAAILIVMWKRQFASDSLLAIKD